MFINNEKFTSCIRTVRQGDDDWTITNGYVITPRAGFEISSRCPSNYKEIIGECIQHGWLKPVAHIYDKELMWEKLSLDNSNDPYPTPW